MLHRVASCRVPSCQVACARKLRSRASAARELVHACVRACVRACMACDVCRHDTSIARVVRVWITDSDGEGNGRAPFGLAYPSPAWPGWQHVESFFELRESSLVLCCVALCVRTPSWSPGHLVKRCSLRRAAGLADLHRYSWTSRRLESNLDKGSFMSSIVCTQCSQTCGFFNVLLNPALYRVDVACHLFDGPMCIYIYIYIYIVH